jgi:hypothetical protein
MNKEIRVYVLNYQDISIDKGFSELTEKEWMVECERQGGVYTLEGFQCAFNGEEIDSRYYLIKFIKI